MLHQRLHIIIAFLAALTMMLASTGSTMLAQTPFTVMEYNCENAFDTMHDEGKDDYEYCAGGAKHWTRWRMANKLRGIAKVIAAADEQRPVDLVALCEVENDTVLTALTRQSVLAHCGYQYVMTHSADARGIDVALLYSPYTFHLIDTQCVIYPPLRDILHVTGTVMSGDSLDVFVVHLPSKLGAGQSFDASMNITAMLQQRVDSVIAVRQHPNVIVMGDFNADARSKQIELLTRQTPLVNLTADARPGTYKYQGVWSSIDHILAHTTSLSPTSNRVVMLPALLEKDETNGGEKPRRTYLGDTYHGGLSDHLPLVQFFQMNKRP